MGTIDKIYVKNFRSFKELNIELNNFNVLIGANASGKSNFLQIFKFLRDIIKHGLKNAISMQGGTEYIRNIKLDSSEDLSFKIVSNNFGALPVEDLTEDYEKEKKLLILEVSKQIYEFAINFKDKEEFKIKKDNLILEGNLVELTIKNTKEDKYKEKKLETGKINFSVNDGKITTNTQGFSFKEPESLLLSEKLELNSILLENPSFISLYPLFGSFFNSISIYDFDPKLPKKAVPITGKIELEEDGSNLAIALKGILDNADKKKKYSNLMNDILPFVEDLDVENSMGMFMFLKLKETCANKFFPASLISDGTINITALIMALYFEDKPFIVIEEPERNMHPRLISKITAMMEEASQKKQITITTHNPQIVKHVDIKNLLLISRDKDGFSVISKPCDKDDVKLFLESKIGIEDLYISDLLG